MEKKFCVFCNKDVEIIKVITHGNYEERILSLRPYRRRTKLIQVRFIDDEPKKCNQATITAIWLTSPLAAISAFI